jgi:Spy/CpxP family protein refolding chaperone
MRNGGKTVRIPARMLVVSMLSLAVLPFAAYSEQSDEGASPERRTEMTLEERRAAWENLSEEEKQAKREQMRARRDQRRAEWEAMTPEEREAKRAERRRRMESMTPEQREAMRKRFEQRGTRGCRHGGKKNQGT